MSFFRERTLLLIISAVIITLSSLLAIIFAIVVFRTIQPETRFVRKNIHSIEAQKDIDALTKAMDSMRRMPCENPLSWYYQAAIHWIPDSIPNNPLCESYQTYLDKKEGWDKCTHTPSGKEKIHFLVWHRLYTYHFEKIVRKISGYSNFALPYWAYTDKDQKNKYLHSSFRTKGSSLYEECRFDSLNNGYPIVGEIERALDMTKLMSYTSYSMFNNNLNAAPHGAMHDYIGHGNDPTNKSFKNPITGTITEDGLMGWVPTAAFDPVFWTHHSNIDRLWQQWTNSENGKLVTLEELKSAEWEYIFYDENGKKVVYTPERIMEILYTMDYDFDDTELKSKENSKEYITQSANRRPFTQEINKKLSGNITTFKVSAPVSSVKQNKNKTAICKVVVSFSKRPRGVYEVYSNLPNGVKPHPSLSQFGGYMTFFGSDHELKAKDCGGGCCKETTKGGRTIMSFEFEIQKSDSYSMSVYKHNGMHAGDIKIESITIKQ